MTAAEFFGCTFLAFGPPFAMFLFTIAHDAIRVIILLVAAFFWLVSLLLSSLLWFAIIPLRDYTWLSLIYSILFQVSIPTVHIMHITILSHLHIGMLSIFDL